MQSVYDTLGSTAAVRCCMTRRSMDGSKDDMAKSESANAEKNYVGVSPHCAS